MWPLSPPAETEKKERGRYDIIFKWHWAAALHSDQVSLCIYRAAGLQTVWLNGCQRHRSARPWLDESLHCLPRIDPPAALLLSALLCCIDVLSNDFRYTAHADVHAHGRMPARRHFENSVTQSTRTYFARLVFNLQGSRRHLIRSLAFLFSSSSSWVVSHCQGQTNQPMLTSGSRKRKTGREIFTAQGLLIDRKVHLQDRFMWVCPCLRVSVGVPFSLFLLQFHFLFSGAVLFLWVISGCRVACHSLTENGKKIYILTVRNTLK